MQGNNFGNGYGMNGYRSGGFAGNASGIGNWFYPNNGYGAQQTSPQNDRIYVSGRVGADAYPLPNGVFSVVLWDNSTKRFYVKGYDNNGIPRVLEDCDYSDHVEPEPKPVPQMDLSKYATKEDIQHMISDAFNHIDLPSMTGYVTTEQLNNELSNLVVGNGGKVVRGNGVS